MRTIDDKKAYVKEVQKFLSLVVSGNGIVFFSGYFDTPTVDALARFKAEMGLGDDKTVDLNTYTLLYEAYENAKKGERVTLRRGDRDDAVLGLNAMLRAVGKEYSDVTRPKPSAYYSSETEEAVIRLSEIFGMTSEGDADSEFILRLEHEYELLSDKIDKKR